MFCHGNGSLWNYFWSAFVKVQNVLGFLMTCMKEIYIMPDIICKWEILLTSLSILKSCFYSLLFLSLVLFYFKKYFGTWGRLFIRVLQQSSSCMMPLKATCKILTIKLILKVLLNHFLILLDLLRLSRASIPSCFLHVPLFSVLTDTGVPFSIRFLIFLPLKAITW